MEIRWCNSTDLLQLRQKVLRPNQDISNVSYLEDDFDTALHLGVFENNVAIACLTAFPCNLANFNYKLSYQLRGLATDESYRKSGLASALINTMLDTLLFKGVDFVWLNARYYTIDFYKKFEFNTYGELFDIANTVKHIKMYKILKDN